MKEKHTEKEGAAILMDSDLFKGCPEQVQVLTFGSYLAWRPDSVDDQLIFIANIYLCKGQGLHSNRLQELLVMYVVP